MFMIVKRLFFSSCATKCLLLSLLIFLFNLPQTALSGDSTVQEGPKILTTDLMPRQKVDASQKIVSFVFDSDDPIISITINGQDQKIKSAKFITLTKDFRFMPGRNLITVKAKDSKTIENTVNYIVIYGKDPDALSKAAEEQSSSPWSLNATIALKYERDDNPTLDFGSPVKLGDMDIQGMVKDSEQPDYRTSMNALATLTKGKGNFKAGIYTIDYTESKYAPLDSEVIILGGGLSPAGKDGGFLFDYMFMDINAGGFDYAQNHMFTTGYLWKKKRSDGSSRTHGLNILYMYKKFAAADAIAGYQDQLSWEYTSLDAQQQDLYRQVFSVGKSQEGFATSKYTYASMDFDWNNKWTSGVLFNTGFGLQGRQYKNEDPLSVNTPLGDKRIDIPFRLSAELGWEFYKQWSVALTGEYNVNLSNKSPWVRTIEGVILRGSF